MENYNINEELENAIRRRKLKEVKALLSAGADVNFREERNRDTLLHITGSVEITKELLLGGAEVNATNMYRETPLHCAITSRKDLELVRELLKHGADVNATNRKGNTALNHAVKNDSNLEIVKELLEYGADINLRNCERRLYDNYSSSLDNAVGKLGCSKLLIKFTLIRNFNKNYKKYIDLAPYAGRCNYIELSSYLEDCVCEVLQMQTDEIKDDLSLYEIVTNNFNKCVLYNNQLSVRLAKIDYSVRYPIYNDIILDKLKHCFKRAELLYKLSKIQLYTKLVMTDQDVKGNKIILDYDSTYNITEYLSNDNLLNFIVAFDDSSKHTIQSLSSINNDLEPGKRLYETSTSNDTKRARIE